jgi:hypothetical protein
MHSRSAFHLDCTGIIPECGFQCATCIAEMQAVFTRQAGVDKFYRNGDGVVVEHDVAKVGAHQLFDLFKGLPSFYKGSFAPTLITS